MLNSLILLALFLTNPTKQKYLSSVELGVATIDSLDKTNIVVELGVGDNIEGQTIHLVQVDSQNVRFRVEIRYQTTMTVMEEGPHFDLLNWKHYTSQWRSLEESSSLTYLVPIFTKEERTRFPIVSKNEIFAAVRKYGNVRWAELVKKVNKPTDYPCGVSISKYFLRISVHEKGKWIILNTLQLISPMGC